MRNKAYIGIDPGASGAIAVVCSNDYYFSVSHKKSYMDQFHELKSVAENNEHAALIENVHAMPSQGVTSSFNFGKSFGASLALLEAAGISYELVQPKKWQEEFDLPTTKTAGGKTAKKNEHKRVAQELFPDVNMTHANADAFLIAEYCRRQDV